jgi:3-oxoacyl-[acyl-carrier protein] reductase
MTIEGRVALVSGGSQGIGKAIVARLLSDGARVAFCARNPREVEAAARELAAIGPDVLGFPADVTEEAQVQALVAACLERFGRIDVLVNNAAIYGPIGPSWDIDPAHWRQTIDVNLIGVFLLNRAVIPTMIRLGGGKIINVSGGGAANPFPRYSAYAASKAAVVRFTETLAVELAEHNIQVNAMAPGMVATRMHEQTLAAGDLAGREFLRKTRDEVSRGGVDPSIPAALVAFLASKEADWITGKFIHAVWDRWADFDDHRDELAQTDVYTLRRIVPADRGMSWR